MCDPKLIHQKVEEFVQADTLFTSVDVANAIKKSGPFVRNREVAAWLRDNMTNEFTSYSTTTIDVCNGTRQATLYHPSWADPDTYANRDQKALSPQDLQTATSATPTGTAQTTAATATQAAKPKSKKVPDIGDVLSGSTSRVIKSVERIKVPGELVQQLGLNPGDPVDAKLFATTRPLPANLYVNADNRVSIPRDCVGFGTSPVKVVFKNGKIGFEQA